MTLALPRQPAPAPPKGFRKAIPAWVKRAVRYRQMNSCATCGLALPLGNVGVEFDHHPAIQLRVWDAEARDTLPPCNDPSFIFARHKKDCHAGKTFGKGGDISEIAKLRNRITPAQEEHRRRMLRKVEPEEVGDPQKRKRKWPSRKLNWRKP